MSELIRTKCHMGQLVITENAIRLETKILGKGNRSLSRSMLTGIDMKEYPRILGIGVKKADLTFYGQGSEIIVAQLVKTEIAKQIVELLGY
jgi:hypothetical protein